jgi:serine-type D-Ala-D-Ala carboxypeptidase/endopeptidase
VKIAGTIHLTFCAVWLTAQFAAAAQNGFTETNDITKFLHDHFDGTNEGMVVGLVDERGVRVFSAGKLGNGTDGAVNGDTVFEIGSFTKTFTTLLLLDMVEQGKMKLDDPVTLGFCRTSGTQHSLTFFAADR